MQCPFCGHELNDDDNYCSHCAAPVRTGKEQSSLEPASLEKTSEIKKNPRIPIVPGAVALLIIGFLLGTIFSSRPNAVPASSNSESGQETVEAEAAAADSYTDEAVAEDSYTEESSETEASSDTSSAELDDMEYFSEKGIMTIGYTDYRPFSYIDEETGMLTGFDIELIKAICDGMGVAYEFVEIDFDNWMADLETYRIDCFLGGLEITPEREQIVSYSTPYLYETDLDVQYGFALRKNSNAVEFFNFMILSEADIGFINDLLNKYWPE